MDQDAYLLELARCIVLSPVRAGFIPSAGEFAWSSYQAVMGKTPAPDWLAVDDTLAMFHSQRGPRPTGIRASYFYRKVRPRHHE